MVLGCKSNRDLETSWIVAIEGSALVENDGCITGLGNLSRKQLCIIGILHKEKVGKQNSIKKALWVVVKLKERIRVIFHCQTSLPLLLSHSLGR